MVRPESGSGSELMVEGSGSVVGGMSLEEANKIILLNPAVDSVIAFLLLFIIPKEEGSGVPT